MASGNSRLASSARSSEIAFAKILLGNSFALFPSNQPLPLSPATHECTRIRWNGRRSMKLTSVKLALSPEQAAEAAGIGRTQLFQLIRSGELKARKCGRRTIILRNELNEWLQSLPTRQPDQA